MKRAAVLIALAGLAPITAFAPRGGASFGRTVIRTAAEKSGGGGLTIPKLPAFKKAAPTKEPPKKKGILGFIPNSDAAVAPVREKAGSVVKGTVNKLPLLSGVRLEALVGMSAAPPS